ncbi:hypothetical protein [Microcoleus sp. A006_D1]
MDRVTQIVGLLVARGCDRTFRHFESAIDIRDRARELPNWKT